MVNLLKFAGAVLASILRPPARREAEILFLRQQVLVLRRLAPSQPRLGLTDRLIFVWLYRLFPAVSDAAVIFKPETLVRWHRRGFRLFWRWKPRLREGHLAIPKEILDLIREMSQDNWLLGCTTNPRRTPHAWRRGRLVDRRQIHAQAFRTAQLESEDVSSQSCRWYYCG